MDGFSRGTVAITAGYLLAFAVGDATGLFQPSWMVLAIAVCGVLGAAAGIRALPDTFRFVVGAASTGGFVVLSAIGFPVTAGLLLAAALMAAASLSLFERRKQAGEA